jgi:anaerobic selenocysteine-containing dehydrogenase
VVTVRGGRVHRIEGSRDNEVTNGYICAKVRHFDQRVYGDDRILHPAVRTGPKGSGRFRRVSWDEALEQIAARMRDVSSAFGAESILPLSYGGSNGLLTQDTTDATFFRRIGASRLLRTVCAAPTGAANQGLYGKMASVSYQDYPAAKLIVVWGVNPGHSGIHIMPFLKQAREAGARLIVIDPRATAIARQADLFLQVRPGTDLAVALAVHRHLFETGRADGEFLRTHATGVDQLRDKAAPWTFERAAHESGVPAQQLERFAELYATTSPALVKCGWGLERNRNGGSAAAAVLALPAVGGKFGVRGGGYSMSNSASWNITRSWIRDPEARTRAINMNHVGRALLDTTTPIKLLFVYNCNPAVTMPDQGRVLKGLEREDLFTVVHDQVLTDTAMYADVVLPATTFLEHYDLVRSYGPITLQLARPVIDQVGESRPNVDLFADLIRRMNVDREDDPGGDLDVMLDVIARLPQPHGDEIRQHTKATAPFEGRPVQFVDVMPQTADHKVHLFPAELDGEAPLGLYGFQPDPATDLYPLALISPASERTVSSTLGELPRPTVVLDIHPEDAEARDIQNSEVVRMFNALGEVRLPVRISPIVKRGTVAMPKGVWRRSISNGFTSNVLVPDALTDLGGGACFNDARVQIEKVTM